MSWLLDTCVISELAKPKPEAAVVSWIDSQPEEELHLSAITLGEVAKGIVRLAQSRRREAMTRWARTLLLDRFAGRILPVDAAVATRWGEIAGISASKGNPLPVLDGLIAATSLVHGLVVATRNTADFERSGARCFNPWLASSAETVP